jgi:dicarboxylate transporter 10
MDIGGVATQVIKSDGFLGLYSGITASLLRQLTYSTVRFGIYEEMKQRSSPDASFSLLCTMAAVSGFAGGVVGNFADVLNVRMQNDAALPLYKRRNYKSALNGLIRMTREEGVRSWFRGWLPNSSRAAVTTASQLASYDVVKRSLMGHMAMEDTLGTQLIASFLAGLTAATVASPIDVIKTMAMSSGRRQGILQMVQDITRREGYRWMFKGWVPSFLRQGP